MRLETGGTVLRTTIRPASERVLSFSDVSTSKPTLPVHEKVTLVAMLDLAAASASSRHDRESKYLAPDGYKS